LVVDKPGLQLDDVILAWNDDAVSSAAQVEGKLSAAQPGTEVTLTLWRDGSERKVKVKLDRALDALVRMNLVKVLSNEAVEKVMAERKYPHLEADRLKAAPIKPDEIELAEGDLNDPALLRYIGRRTISRYGCFGCHEIPGFEKARPIGTALQDWGRKDPSKLALEHIEEYLHHHGEKDGSSTMDRVAKAVEDGVNGRFPSAETADQELSAAYYVDQINHHGRGGFLWQKLREPRSYDYKKVETKGFDERLKMPRFPFSEADIEAVATFVLGLTAEPPAREFVYQPKGAAKARIEGEKLITKFNCSGCHMLELPEITYAANVGEFRLDLTDEQKEKLTAGEAVEVTGASRWNALKEYLEGTPSRIYAREVDPADLARVDLAQLESITKGIKAASEAKAAVHIPTDALLALHDRLRAAVPDAGVEAFYKRFLPFVETLAIVESSSVDHPQAFDALMKLKPPIEGLAGPGKTAGELLVKFKALVNSVPDPEDDPADQEFGYDLWETLKVGNKVQVPSSRMLVPALKQIATTQGRGGEFAEWLTNHSMANDRGLDRSKARQMAPPPLYKEGVKVQTPWLYSFLKNPGKIRYTPLLRMPQFSLSDQEAQTLANYFAAVDGAPFPYQPIPQRDPAYLETMESAHANYLKESWDLVTMAPPTGLCAGCHSVGGREFVAGDPTKVVRGPNLEGVYNRLQPDWVELWIYNPKWITPYTSMPQNFPAGKQQFPELLGGDGQLQSVASRDALMNYLRMLEKTGKPTPTPSPAAAPAAAAVAPPAAETAKVEDTK
jgi:mono/diheme cytochrome c family protein